MNVLVADPVNGLYPWKSEDGKFMGYLIESFTFTGGEPVVAQEMPAGALLAVPKYSPNDPPSINKYSPMIAQAPTLEELRPRLESWLDRNHGKRLWDLRKL